MRRLILSALALIASLAVAASAQAQAEWREIKKLQLEGAPVDVATSPDGQTIFVLNDRSQVLVYAPDGRLKGTLQLDEQADAISTWGRGDALLVSNSRSGSARLLAVELIQKISVDGSPFKGPEGAPVTMVVFDDFQ